MPVGEAAASSVRFSLTRALARFNITLTLEVDMRDYHKASDGGKAKYETPVLTRIGTFEAITQGGRGVTALDASFPAHTPIGSLTFS
jgi:hypothetical protein